MKCQRVSVCQKKKGVDGNESRGMRMRGITMSESGRKGVAYLGEVKLTNHVDCTTPATCTGMLFLCPLCFFSPSLSFPPRIKLA